MVQEFGGQATLPLPEARLNTSCWLTTMDLLRSRPELLDVYVRQPGAIWFLPLTTHFPRQSRGVHRDVQPSAQVGFLPPTAAL